MTTQLSLFVILLKKMNSHSDSFSVIKLLINFDPITGCRMVFSSTIRSIWRAVLLTLASASASASPVLIKVLVQLHIFYCTFKSFYGIHLKLQIYVPYHHPYNIHVVHVVVEIILEGEHFGS